MMINRYCAIIRMVEVTAPQSLQYCRYITLSSTNGAVEWQAIVWDCTKIFWNNGITVFTGHFKRHSFASQWVAYQIKRFFPVFEKAAFFCGLLDWYLAQRSASTSTSSIVTISVVSNCRYSTMRTRYCAIVVRVLWALPASCQYWR